MKTIAAVKLQQLIRDYLEYKLPQKVIGKVSPGIWRGDLYLSIKVEYEESKDSNFNTFLDNISYVETQGKLKSRIYPRGYVVTMLDYGWRIEDGHGVRKEDLRKLWDWVYDKIFNRNIDRTSTKFRKTYFAIGAKLLKEGLQPMPFVAPIMLHEEILIGAEEEAALELGPEDDLRSDSHIEEEVGEAVAEDLQKHLGKATSEGDLAIMEEKEIFAEHQVEVINEVYEGFGSFYDGQQKISGEPHLIESDFERTLQGFTDEEKIVNILFDDEDIRFGKEHIPDMMEDLEPFADEDVPYAIDMLYEKGFKFGETPKTLRPDDMGDDFVMMDVPLLSEEKHFFAKKLKRRQDKFVKVPFYHDNLWKRKENEFKKKPPKRIGYKQ